MKIFTTALLLLGSVLLTGCGEDASGAPPELNQIFLLPPEATLGETDRIQGKVGFADDDGDIAFLTVAITDPSGDTTWFPRSELFNTLGVSAGVFELSVGYEPVSCGVHFLHVWVHDEQLNTSNRQTAELFVNCP